MKKAVVALMVAMVLAMPAQAQSNNDDFTPLGSRIKRDRQFPVDLPHRFGRDQYTKVNRDRSKAMLAQFSQCLYRRSNEKSLELLARTDLGFVNFQQIELEQDRALRIYGFNDCLNRVATSNSTGVVLRFSPGALRQWLLQEAYFSRYPEGPDWVKPGHVIGERQYPLSSADPGIRSMMDFADCVIQADPYGADYFFRVPAGTEGERSAIKSLVPSLGPCLPEGVEMELQPYSLRVWLGEGLWHGANNSAPPPEGAAAAPVSVGGVQ